MKESTKLDYVVKQCKRVMHTHSGCGSPSTMKRTQCTLQSMWCSPQHSTWGAGSTALHPYTGWDCHFLAPASSVSCCGPVMWPSCSACPGSGSAVKWWWQFNADWQADNDEPNLLRVSDWITVQLFCSIAQSLTQWIKRDTSEGSTEATTCTDRGCLHEKWPISQYVRTATTVLRHCMSRLVTGDQKFGRDSLLRHR